MYLYRLTKGVDLDSTNPGGSSCLTFLFRTLALKVSSFQVRWQKVAVDPNLAAANVF